MTTENHDAEYALWLAAIEVAIYPALSHNSKTVYAAKVPWRLIEELRAALDAVGIDWRKAKQRNDECPW